MKTILEHFTFIPPMLNIHSDKVKYCSVYSLIGVVLSEITGFIEYLSHHVLGLTIGFTLSLFAVMIVDFITGVLASLMDGKKKGPKKRKVLNSKRGLGWVVKFIAYVMGIYIVYSLYKESLTMDTILAPVISEILILIKFYIILHILIWEIKSIDENAEKLGFSLNILKLMNKVGNAGKDSLENKINEKMNKIIIQIVDVKDSEALINKHLNEKNMPEVGFHYMIESDGTTKIGRTISNIGNHYVSENSSSIGVALIGVALTKAHESAIDSLLEDLSIKSIDTNNVLIVENGELKKYR